jgi:hypothetical protein
VGLGGITFLPKDDSSVPAVPELKSRADGCGGYVSSPCRGTDGGKMADRARRQAEWAIDLLRAGMRTENAYHAQQLLFRLGETYAFSETAGGWDLRADTPFSASFDRAAFDRIAARPFAKLPANPRTDLERRAVLAVEWIGRSLKATSAVSPSPTRRGVAPPPASP